MGQKKVNVALGDKRRKIDPSSDEMVAIVVKLPAITRKNLKLVATMQGTSMTRLIEDAIERIIEGARQEQIKRSGGE